MMPAAPTTRDAIVAYIKDFGPSTGEEIAAGLEITKNAVQKCISATRKRRPGQFFRIVGHLRYFDHAGLPAPLWGLGPGRDCPSPIMGEVARQQTRARYRASRRAMINAQKRVTVATPWDNLLRLAA